ncbi:MAG: hypothetical protein ACYDC0_07660 [Acidimicrobiales bacterium]
MTVLQGSSGRLIGQGALTTNEVLDAVVPRNLSPVRMAMVVVVLMALGTAGWLVRWEGGFAPGLVFGSTFAESGSKPGHVFIEGPLESTKLFPVTITGVDAAAPGLGGAVVTFASMQGRPLQLPIYLSEGKPVTVRITWRHLTCSAIRTGERYMPVHYTDFAGLSGTVGMAPLTWMQPRPGGGSVSVGWATGLTWTACGHPRGEAPVPDG